MGNTSSSIYLVPDDLLEEIFLLLPAESIQSCRSVSKNWRSVVESKRFTERHKNLQKRRRKILVAYDCDCRRWPRLLPKSRFEGDEEMVYLHYNTLRPLMTCEGLVCFPDPDWIQVLNPSTGQIRRFPSDLNTFVIGTRSWINSTEAWSMGFGIDKVNSTGAAWSMGFGRDKVTGSFKIVKIHGYRPGRECSVLDFETGKWRKVALPCYVRRLGNHSACVNGSIYWVYKDGDDKLLAFDLHKEEFHDVSVPGMFLTCKTQVVNLEDRVALASSKQVGGGSDWILEILTMDAAEEGRWSKTYSISLPRDSSSRLFRPVSLSRQGGDLVLYDDCNMLYKYYPETDKIRSLSSDTRVLSPYLEHLAPVAVKSSHPPLPVPVSPEYTHPFRTPCPFFQPPSWKSYLHKQTSWAMYFLILFCSICLQLFLFDSACFL